MKMAYTAFPGQESILTFAFRTYPNIPDIILSEDRYDIVSVIFRLRQPDILKILAENYSGA